MSDSLQSHELQDARLPCPSLSPRDNDISQMHVHWVGDAIQPSHPLSSPSPLNINLSQHQGFFPMSQFFASGGQSIGVSASAISPSNECSGLISYRIDWFDLLVVQGILMSLLQYPSYWVQNYTAFAITCERKIYFPSNVFIFQQESHKMSYLPESDHGNLKHIQKANCKGIWEM